MKEIQNFLLRVDLKDFLKYPFIVSFNDFIFNRTEYKKINFNSSNVKQEIFFSLIKNKIDEINFFTNFDKNLILPFMTKEVNEFIVSYYIKNYSFDYDIVFDFIEEFVTDNNINKKTIQSLINYMKYLFALFPSKGKRGEILLYFYNFCVLIMDKYLQEDLISCEQINEVTIDYMNYNDDYINDKYFHFENEGISNLLLCHSFKSGSDILFYVERSKIISDIAHSSLSQEKLEKLYNKDLVEEVKNKFIHSNYN